MSLLAGLGKKDSIQEDEDRVGGGGFQPLDSDIYPMEVEVAYVSKSKGGALALNLHFSGEANTKFRTQLWMASGDEKGNKNYYEKKDKATGKIVEHYLPGFNQATALSLLTVGEEIANLGTEVKTINLYDFAAKAEVPTDVDSIPALVGEKIYVGIVKQLVDKNVKDEATGKYVPSGETREENEINKLFRIDDKLTKQEIEDGIEQPIFYDKWLAGWKGKVQDKTSKTGVKQGAPRQAGAAAPTKKLFGKK